jgi:hypothetical protein
MALLEQTLLPHLHNFSSSWRQEMQLVFLFAQTHPSKRTDFILIQEVQHAVSLFRIRSKHFHQQASVSCSRVLPPRRFPQHERPHLFIA